MINGVTEISKKPVVGMWPYSWIIFVILAAGFLILWITLVIKDLRKGETYSVKESFMVFLITILSTAASNVIACIVSLAVMLFNPSACPVSYYTYTVTVDDSVNFNQFMEKYQIIKENSDGTYLVILRNDT